MAVCHRLKSFIAYECQDLFYFYLLQHMYYSFLIFVASYAAPLQHHLPYGTVSVSICLFLCIIRNV